VVDDPGVPNDGEVDANGNCLDHIEIFAGRALRCRPPGLLDTFQNCCKDKGKIVKDGMGSSLSSLSTKIAVAKGVLSGMKAAYTAFKAGATASEAASAGLHGIIGIDPTSLAISLAINFMIEVLLQGVAKTRVRFAILDITGVPDVDDTVADHLAGTIDASRLMGAAVIITGLSAEIAQTLVAIGADISKLNTAGDLQGGIEEAERLLGFTLTRTDGAVH